MFSVELDLIFSWIGVEVIGAEICAKCQVVKPVWPLFFLSRKDSASQKQSLRRIFGNISIRQPFSMDEF